MQSLDHHGDVRLPWGKAGARYFEFYWTKYLYPEETAGERARFGSTLYLLVRHGIAHVYTPKAPLTVVLNKPSEHLKRDANGRVHLDAKQLANDFIESYELKIKPLVTGTAFLRDAVNMPTRLSEIYNQYRPEANKLRDCDFPPLAEAYDAEASKNVNVRSNSAGGSGPPSRMFASKL